MSTINFIKNKKMEGSSKGNRKSVLSCVGAIDVSFSCSTLCRYNMQN